MKLNYFFTFLFMCSLSINGQNTFSKEDVLLDLEYLKTSLEETHFDLYAHTNKKAFEENCLEVKKLIKNDSLSFLEVVNLLQTVVSKANNAHTRVAFHDYAQPYIAHYNSGGSVFPLEVAIENSKVLIRKNWSSNANINIGAELKSINGLPINEVFKKIYPQIAAENLYFKNAQLEAFTLPRYYWQVFGEFKTFDVEIKHLGVIKTYKLDAINAMSDYEENRHDIIKNTWDLKYLSTSSAYLRPGAFGGDEVRYRQFIDSAFIDIKTKSIKSLIIDLRNHSGGNDSFGDYLVSYIADRPFKWTSGFQLKTSALLKEDIKKNRDTTQEFWNSALVHENGEIYPYDFGFYEAQEEHKRFKGKVYVLVNRQSYSQSTVTASQIQDYGFGKIVGEETAENPNLFASIFTYELPITKIKIDVPKGKIRRINGIDTGKGVVPDIVIKDYLLDEEDEILEGLIKKIN